MARFPATKVLDGLACGLAALNAAMLVTGGATFSIGAGKLELSSLDPWMMALGLMLALRWRLAGEASPAWRYWIRGLERVSKPLVSRRWAISGILLAIGAAVLAHVFRHLSLHTDGLDVAYVHQPLFHPLQPRLLTCDVCVAGTYLGEHLGFSLLLIAPLARLWGDFGVFVLQGLLIGGALWLGIAQGVLRKTPVLFFAAAVVALSHRSLRAGVIWDFREDVLAFAALMGCVVALTRVSWLGYALSLALALLSKEIVCLIVPFLAIPILLDRELPIPARQRRVAAAATVLAGAAYALLAFRVLFPLFNPYAAGAQQIAARLSAYGSTPGEVLLNVAISPRVWWDILSTRILTAEALKYTLLLLLPSLYFLRRSPWWLVPALPGMAMNWMGISNQRTLQFHYDLVILPFLLAGAWLGMRKMASETRRGLASRLAIGVFLALAFSGRWPVLMIRQHWPSSAEAADARFLQRLSFDETVGASYRTLAQLAAAESLRVFRSTGPAESWEAFWASNSSDFSRIPGRSVQEARVWVLDREDPGQRQALERIERRAEWGIEGSSPSGRFVVTRRR